MAFNRTAVILMVLGIPPFRTAKTCKTLLSPKGISNIDRMSYDQPRVPKIAHLTQIRCSQIKKREQEPESAFVVIEAMKDGKIYITE